MNKIKTTDTKLLKINLVLTTVMLIWTSIALIPGMVLFFTEVGQIKYIFLYTPFLFLMYEVVQFVNLLMLCYDGIPYFNNFGYRFITLPSAVVCILFLFNLFFFINQEGFLGQDFGSYFLVFIQYILIPIVYMVYLLEPFFLLFLLMVGLQIFLYYQLEIGSKLVKVSSKEDSDE